jgi:hypothetical protein
MSSQSFPNLAIVPLENILVHEWYDERRTLPLLERIRSSGVFRNPPIVTPIPGERDQFVVLDGANRTAALRKMGYPHILVQIVESDDPGFRLRTWNHVLLDWEPVQMLAELKDVPGLDLVSSTEPHILLPYQREIGIALIQTVEKRVYAISAPANDLIERIAVLNAVVSVYQEHAIVDRTSFSDIDELLSIYPRMCALIIFPKFNINDLIILASQGCMLPAGITRTTVSPRALYVNLPLEVLTGELSLAEKNARLEKLICDRMAWGKIAYNAEAAFLFDE